MWLPYKEVNFYLSHTLPWNPWPYLPAASQELDPPRGWGVYTPIKVSTALTQLPVITFVFYFPNLVYARIGLNRTRNRSRSGIPWIPSSIGRKNAVVCSLSTAVVLGIRKHTHGTSPLWTVFTHWSKWNLLFQYRKGIGVSIVIITHTVTTSLKGWDQ